MGNYILGSDGELYSQNELYHYGVLGMKWGVRRYQNKDGSFTPVGKKRARNRDNSDKNISDFSTAMRVTRAANKDMRATIKLSKDMSNAAMSDYRAVMKYASTGRTLQVKYRSQFKQVINSYLDSINDDISKVHISKDYFTKHQRDSAEDVLADGNNAMIMYMLLVAESNDQAMRNR